MNIFKWFKHDPVCEHEERGHGWSYMKCDKCERVRYAPDEASAYWSNFFKTRYKDHPELITGELRIKLGIRGVDV